MKEKYNFRIDSANGTVAIDVSLSVYPKPVILHAAYHFIEEGKVILEGGDKIITVTLILDKKLDEAELEEIAYEFNIQLISSFVESVESERHAKIRDEIVGAALRSPYGPPPKTPATPPPPSSDQKS